MGLEKVPLSCYYRSPDERGIKEGITDFKKRVHWIVKTEECFKKQLENLTNERTLSTIARRLNVLISSDVDLLQRDVAIEVGLIMDNHFFVMLH
uniref:Uncharacterized protein n=1 Tax=Vespula pensylvanica TaxID=30213 RepID=A0A834MZ41_VESPE|nr:hypothetical protein H0235_017584 [Vespula pensylvanica]